MSDEDVKTIERAVSPIISIEDRLERIDRTENNLAALFEAEHGMTVDQRRAFCNFLIGCVAQITPQKDWLESVKLAEQIARRQITPCKQS